MCTFDELLCNLLILCKSKKKNVPLSFTFISMVITFKKVWKHSGKYIYVLIKKTKILKYIATMYPSHMWYFILWIILCVDHDWTSRFCFSVPMSTLYIYIFVMNAESHNAYQWLCLVIVNVFCIWPFLLGIFCFVFYVILICFIYNTDFNFKICFGTAFGVRYNVLKSMREPFSVSDFISPS